MKPGNRFVSEQQSDCTKLRFREPTPLRQFGLAGYLPATELHAPNKVMQRANRTITCGNRDSDSRHPRGREVLSSLAESNEDSIAEASDVSLLAPPKDLQCREVELTEFSTVFADLCNHFFEQNR